jgi:hypothetical protein
MARLPVGVAMGVSGEAHTQAAQPVGQVPASVGWKHAISVGPWVTSQQSWSPAQGGLQSGALHVPLLQKWVAAHSFPHVPQFKMSFLRFAHRPPQHWNGGVHGPQSPPLELEVVAPVVLEVVELPELAAAPVPLEVPPPWPTTKLLPQATRQSTPTAPPIEAKARIMKPSKVKG